MVVNGYGYPAREEAGGGVTQAELFAGCGRKATRNEDVADSASAGIAKILAERLLLLLVPTKGGLALSRTAGGDLRVFVVSLDLDAENASGLFYCVAESQAIALLDVLDGVATVPADVTEAEPLLVIDGERGVGVIMPWTLGQELVANSLELTSKCLHD